MKLHITSLIHGYETSRPISKPLMRWKRTLSYISLAGNLKALFKPRGTHNWKPLNWSLISVKCTIISPCPPHHLLETTEIEHQIDQLLEYNIFNPPPPHASHAFIIPKKETIEWCLVTDYDPLTNPPLKIDIPYPRLRICWTT
jgi:hypothetical protein